MNDTLKSEISNLIKKEVASAKSDILDETITIINNRINNINNQATNQATNQNPILSNDFLNKLRILDSWSLTNVKKVFTSAPTHNPRNKDEQIIFYKNGADYKLYLWVGDAWKYVNLTS